MNLTGFNMTSLDVKLSHPQPHLTKEQLEATAKIMAKGLIQIGKNSFRDIELRIAAINHELADQDLYLFDMMYMIDTDCCRIHIYGISIFPGNSTSMCPIDDWDQRDEFNDLLTQNTLSMKWHAHLGVS